MKSDSGQPDDRRVFMWARPIGAFMEEITLGLPGETKAALEAEAEERGVDVSTHIRDIVDAYRAKRDVRSTVGVEYVHSCQAGSELEHLDSPDAEREEIGSFSYGSRSIRSR